MARSAACWKWALASSRIDGANGINHLVSMSIVANQVEIGGMISRTPGIKHGSPHIAGTGVLVRTIARWSQAGLLPEEIAANYGFLQLHQVHAALAYYYANRAEIDADLARNNTEAEHFEAEARAGRL